MVTAYYRPVFDFDGALDLAREFEGFADLIDAARDRLGDDLDRIEEAGAGLARLVADAYRRFAAEHPDRWVVVDAGGSIEEVAERVRAAVEDRLGL